LEKLKNKKKYKKIKYKSKRCGMYRRQYSSKYRAAHSAGRMLHPTLGANSYSASYSGYGAYRKRYVPKRRYAPARRYIKGRGSYYVKGSAGGSAKIPGVAKVRGDISAGYMSGLGAYNISNISHNVLIKPEVPEIRNSLYAEGGTIVRHREYLGPVISSGTANTFKIQSYPLNPAQITSFPWLFQIASAYEEYRPNGLMYEFRSTASDAIASSTNLALGQLMMCTQYDPTDPIFTTDIEMLNYSWAQSGKVSDNVQHFVECDPKQSPLSHLYTRQGGVSSASDIRFSDFGVFSIATNGLQGTNVQIGQLWVTYEFIFYKPKLGDASAEAGGWFHYANASANTPITATNPFGTNLGSGIQDRENNLGVVLATVSNAGLVEIPKTSAKTAYQITVCWVGAQTASIAAPVVAIVADTGCQLINHTSLNTSTAFRTPATVGNNTQMTATTWVIVDSAQDAFGDLRAKVGFTCPVMFVSGVYVDIYVCQIPFLDEIVYGP